MDDFWATVCETVALCYRYRSVVGLSVLSPVCNVGALAVANPAVGWIKMKLGMQVYEDITKAP